MSEGKMELRELSDGRVLRFDPATGKTWQLTRFGGWDLIAEPEEEDDDAGDQDDGPALMRYERVPGTDLMVPPATMAVLAPLLERGITLEHCVVGDNDLPGIYRPSDTSYTWRDLLRAGAAPETTEGTIPTASPIPDTRGTVRFIGQRKATDGGEGEEEQPDEKPEPEPDYRSSTAWE